MKSFKEFVEMNEASWTAAASMYAASRNRSRVSAQPTHDLRVGDKVKTKDNKTGEISFVDGNDIHVVGTNIYYPNRKEKHDASNLVKVK